LYVEFRHTPQSLNNLPSKNFTHPNISLAFIPDSISQFTNWCNLKSEILNFERIWHAHGINVVEHCLVGHVGGRFAYFEDSLAGDC